jgi:hypothetical protein
VVFGGIGQADLVDALLIEGDAPAPANRPVARYERGTPAPSHAPGCACCGPRNAVTMALTRLFLARTRGEVAFFHRVVAVPLDAEGEEAVRAAVQDDPLACARFRVA